MWYARHLLLIIMLVIPFAAATASPDAWRNEGWKTDFSKAAVPFSEILSGGPPKDGIPSIDDPKFVKATNATRYDDREPVIVLTAGSKAKAYPLSILTWHEIVNDEIDGRPVAVTFCPLCNASLVFDRRLGDQILDFGTTGKLRNSDLVMYDRQTESWWQQFTGEAIFGELMGKKLTMIPSRVTSHAEFVKTHPDGLVLVPNNASFRDYGRNPYVNYDSRSAPYPLFQGALPDGIGPMERVVLYRDDGRIVAVALEHLRKNSPLQLGGVTLRWSEGVASALDSAEIKRGREVGAVDIRKSSSNELLVHDITFAFVLFAFHPDVPVLTSEGKLALKARS